MSEEPKDICERTGHNFGPKFTGTCHVCGAKWKPWENPCNEIPLPGLAEGKMKPTEIPEEITRITKDGKIHCPECEGMKFYSGPAGGGSENILCARCGSEYCFSLGTLSPMDRKEERACFYGLKQLPSYEDGMIEAFLEKIDSYSATVRPKLINFQCRLDIARAAADRLRKNHG